MKKKAIYPGTFDPLTYGHIDIIKRASTLFDELIVAVTENNDKTPLFSLEDRTQFVHKAVSGSTNVTVTSFNKVLVDFAHEQGINIIIRGLRAVSDFEYEFQMALMNKELRPDIEPLFIMSDSSYSFVSSKMIKQIAQLNGDLSKFVPDFVVEAVRNKLSYDLPQKD